MFANYDVEVYSHHSTVNKFALPIDEDDIRNGIIAVIGEFVARDGPAPKAEGLRPAVSTIHRQEIGIACRKTGIG